MSHNTRGVGFAAGWTRTCVIILSLQLLLAGTLAAKPFRQPRFAVGMWVEPPVDGRAEERYRVLAAAGFNLVIGGFGARTPEERLRQIRLCERNKLSLILGKRTGDTFSETSPALWGFALWDEPSRRDFQSIAEKLAELRRKAPGRLGFINLFPSYATSEQLGASSFTQYLSSYLTTVRPDVLCLDHYPYMEAGRDGRAAFRADLESLRRHSLRAKIPFWIFINSIAFGDHADPADSQVRWQAFTALAYGARGVLYFTYETPPGAEFEKTVALIDRNGKPSRHYWAAQKINTTLRIFGQRLFQSLPEGVSEQNGVLVGKFRGGWWLVVNQSDTRPTTFYLNKTASEVHSQTGGEHLVPPGGYPLDAGGARLFRFR